MTGPCSCRDAALLGPLLNGVVARWRDATSLSFGVTELTRELEVAAGWSTRGGPCGAD